MGQGDLSENELRRPRFVIQLKGSIAGGACTTVAAIGSPDAIGPSRVVDPKKLAGVELLVDTGATDSCIRTDVARALALPVTGSREIRGFNSKTLCQVVEAILVLRKRGMTEFKPVPLIVADIDVPMIFGMSEIAQGTLLVSGLKGHWRWSSPRPTADRNEPSG
jgi:hypothetical protein